MPSLVSRLMSSDRLRLRWVVALVREDHPQDRSGTSPEYRSSFSTGVRHISGVKRRGTGQRFGAVPPLPWVAVSGWTVIGESEVLAAHAALLSRGYIVYFSGSEYNPDQHNESLNDHTRLYECATGNVTAFGSPSTDLFCCGHASLCVRMC